MKNLYSLRNALVIVSFFFFSVKVAAQSTNSATQNASLSGAVSGNTSVCQDASSPFVTFTGYNGVAPYTFTYTINNGSKQTVTTVSGNTVKVAVPATAAGRFTYNLISVQDSSAAVVALAQKNTATVTVNSSPDIDNTTETICSGTAFNVTPDKAPEGTSYTWGAPSYNGAVSGGTFQNRQQESIKQTLGVAGIVGGTATYNIVPAANGCIGHVFTITARVNPLPVVSDAAVEIVSGKSFEVSPKNVPDGTAYTWSMPKYEGSVSGGTAQGNGQSKVSDTLYANSQVGGKAKYTVIPTTGGCSGKSFAVTVTINPTPASVVENSTNVTTLSIQLNRMDNGNTATAMDKAVVMYNDKFSNAIGSEDTYEVAHSNENIAINRNGAMLSVEGRSAINASDTVPLKVWQFGQQAYSFTLTAANFSSLTTAFVKDAYLNTETAFDLSSVTSVPFSITADSASFAPGRFSIIFKTGGVLALTISNVKAYSKDKGIEVEWTAEAETNVQSYVVEKSANGITFTQAAVVTPKGNIASQNYNWFDANVFEGVNFYRIKITDRSGAVKYSQVVSVTIGKGNTGIKVFPNPVTGNVIGLQINNLEKGKYNLNLYSSNGQKVYNGVIDYSGGSVSYRIQTGANLGRAMYILQVKGATKTMNVMVMAE